MMEQKRELIEKLLFEVYDKGLQQQDCNLTAYYEKILQTLTIPDVVAMLPTENECTKWAEKAANMYPPEQWTDGFEQGYELGMIAVIEMIKEKLQGN